MNPWADWVSVWVPTWQGGVGRGQLAKGLCVCGYGGLACIHLRIRVYSRVFNLRAQKVRNTRIQRPTGVYSLCRRTYNVRLDPRRIVQPCHVSVIIGKNSQHVQMRDGLQGSTHYIYILDNLIYILSNTFSMCWLFSFRCQRGDNVIILKLKKAVLQRRAA